MKVLLLQIDGKMPNLALMKLSAFHKQKGDIVGWKTANPDIVYVSVIFSWNASQAKGVCNFYRKFYPHSEVIIGGPGLGKPTNVPEKAEGIMPDYAFYGIDYSMGFTSRGCSRNCPWCIVPRIEGSLREAVPIEKFHHPDHEKIILMDNNLLAAPNWKKTLTYLVENQLKTNFSQGLDIRLIDEEKASILGEVKACTWTFKTPMMHFAWDLPQEEKEVKAGIETLLNAGIKRRDLTFYVLTGFNTTHAQDLYRVKTLTDYGINPYVMVYNNRKDDRFLTHLERWTNNPYVRKICEFNEYDRLPRKIKEEAGQILNALFSD